MKMLRGLRRRNRGEMDGNVYPNRCVTLHSIFLSVRAVSCTLCHSRNKFQKEFCKTNCQMNYFIRNGLTVTATLKEHSENDYRPLAYLIILK